MTDPTVVLYIGASFAFCTIITCGLSEPKLLKELFLRSVFAPFSDARASSKLDLKQRLGIELSIIGVNRILLILTLLFTSWGLLLIGGFFLLDGVLLPGLSFVFYSIVMFFLSVPVVTNRTVYRFWEQIPFKFIFAAILLSTSFVAATNPEAISIFNIITNYDLVSLNIAILSSIVAFFLILYFVRKSMPSLRTIILRIFEHKVEWVNFKKIGDLVNSNPKYRLYSNDAIRRELNHLIYQGVVEIRWQKNHIRYRKSLSAELV